MSFAHTVDSLTYRFPDLRSLLAKASAARSGDALAGVAAGSAEERFAARMALADLPLAVFASESVIPYELDDVTRLILDSHDQDTFAAVASFTVGEFREWLLAAPAEDLSALARGLTPEMAAAVSKLMRNQDLISVARKCRVVTRFRNTIGLPGRLSVRLQPNHPTDDARGIAASILDGLMYGCGDAVIGVNPAGDGLASLLPLWQMMAMLIERYRIPTQSCVLTHRTTHRATQTPPVRLQIDGGYLGQRKSTLCVNCTNIAATCPTIRVPTMATISPSFETRSARLGLRATPQQEAVLRRAAEVAQKSLTEFILDSACLAAEQTLLDQRLFMVSGNQYQALMELLEQPEKANEGLRELMSRRAPWDNK